MFACPSLTNPSHECQESFSGCRRNQCYHFGSGRHRIPAGGDVKKFLLMWFLFSQTASLSICAAMDHPAPPCHGVFLELPLTGIKPLGWLAEILRRQKDGLALNRAASGYPFNTNLWVGKIDRAGWPAYEQTAYFIDGSYRCGLLVNNPSLIDQGLKNIHFVLRHPQPDGKLGPGPADMKLKVGSDGVAGPQVMGANWPMSVFTRALMAYYGETGDETVLDALTRHYLSLSDKFGIDNRDVDAIEGMCWLSLKTGDLPKWPSGPGKTL